MSYKDNNGNVQLINLGEWKPETRTALFWDNEEWKTFVGDEGIVRFMDGYSGRLIQSPKSFLNSVEEPKTIYGWKERGLGDIVTGIISDFRDRFIVTTGMTPEHIRLGRPVRFHDSDLSRDELAQNRLESYAKNAGFQSVDFEYEPVAAAKTFEHPEILEGKKLLVADFWGGTSDFSVIDYKQNGEMEVISNDWVYVAGNSFDEKLSLRFFSRFLGNGSQYHTGTKFLDVPNQPYFLLSDWKNIHKIHEKAVRLSVENIRNAADDKDGIDRLLEIISYPELGYEYFRAVEKAKIASSYNDPVQGNLNFFKKACKYSLTGEQFREITAEQIEKIRDALRSTLKHASISNDDIWKILLVGGTGQLRVIQEMLEEEVGRWKILKGDTFNAIGRGLSIW